MTRRTALASALLAVMVPWMGAGDAGARPAPPPPRSFFGVTLFGPALLPGYDLAHQAQRIRAVGAGSIAVAFDWQEAQPVAGTAFSFRTTDRFVGAAARAQLEVLPVVTTSPVWARRLTPYSFSPPRNPATYAAYLRVLVRRYGPGGTFWRVHPRLRARPIRRWQVWNEPVGGDAADSESVFWRDDRPFQRTYVDLLRHAAVAVHSVDPRAQIALGGLVGRSWETLELLYKAGARGSFDAVDLHPYTGNPLDVPRIVGFVRRVMRRHGDGRLPIVVSEMGWPSFDGDLAGHSAAELARRQPRYVRRAIAAVAGARRRLRIAAVFWHSWVASEKSRTYAFDYVGLNRFSADGRTVAKPGLQAFRASISRVR